MDNNQALAKAVIFRVRQSRNMSYVILKSTVEYIDLFVTTLE